MSYDYDGIVSSIVKNRKLAYDNDDGNGSSIIEEYVQKSVDSFTKFSQECPMTPMLWMQYAWDSSVMVRTLLDSSNNTNEENTGEIQKQCLEMRNSILTMALIEFPGSALLWRMYLEGLLQQKLHDSETQDEDCEEIEEAFNNAIHQVGRGSHRNQDDNHVAAIFRLRVTYYLFTKQRPNASEPSKQKIDEKIRFTIFQRAATPMHHANESLLDELRLLMEENKQPNLLTTEDFNTIEEKKRFASKYFDILSRLEISVSVAMDQEGITSSSIFQHEENNGFLDWQELLKSNDDGKYLMGLGMIDSAKAFVNYANQLWNFQKSEKKKRKESKSEANGSADESDDDYEEERLEALNIISLLATSVYERGISECPTVELIWEKYIKHLLYLIQNGDDQSKRGMIVAQMKNVCRRAVRNCPYSVALYKHKLQVLDLESETVFDPDNAMEIVKDAIAVGFLPDARSQLEVYMSAIQLVKTRLLQLITKATTSTASKSNPISFDDVYVDDRFRGKKKKRTISDNNKGPLELSSLDDNSKQDALDLAEDLREMYDAADSFLRKNHAKWTKGRALLLYDRAQTEAFILTPLFQYTNDDNTESENEGVDTAISCFEKLVRVHQPPHPDSWLSYINYILGRPINHYSRMNQHDDALLESPGITTLKLRQIRGLFQKAMSTVKKQQESVDDNDDIRNYDFALCNLCHTYLQFEKTFGSIKSYQMARKLTNGKLSSTTPQLMETIPVSDEMNHSLEEDMQKQETENKRKLSDDNIDNQINQDNPEPAYKKPKTSKENDFQITLEHAQDVVMDDSKKNDDNDITEKVEKKTNLKEPKLYPEYTVKVGKLEYPAHPFTIHVSNLSMQTQDMDLVDLFRTKCGKIVHARILRDKHKSKGSGLIQFEERESVDSALELDGVVGLHEKLINIKRSHMPAVSVVPPGMHRVKPKGEGKVSKRNIRRKEKFGGDTEKDGDKINHKMENSNKKDENDSSFVGKQKPDTILAFRPRAIRSNTGGKPRKPSVSIDGEK